MILFGSGGASLFEAQTLPAGAYNSLVVGIILILWFWFTRSIFSFSSLYFRVLKHADTTEAIFLEGASSFAGDFVILFRSHFNQIIRKKRCIPSIPLPRVLVQASVESISFVNSAKSYSQSANERLIKKKGVTFEVDAATPCSIQLFWGVSYSSLRELVESAADSRDNTVVRVDDPDASRPSSLGLFSRFRRNNAYHGLLEMGSVDARLPRRDFGTEPVFSFLATVDCLYKSKEYHFDAGLKQVFSFKSTDKVDLESLLLEIQSHNKALSKTEKLSFNEYQNEMKVPLVILTAAQPSHQATHSLSTDTLVVHEASYEFTIVSLKNKGNEFVINMIKQIVYSTGISPQEPCDIYGLDEAGKDCLICMANPTDTVLLPCRHCPSCYDCLRSFRQEKCPICRSLFSASVTFPIRKDREFAPPTSSSSLNNHAVN